MIQVVLAVWVAAALAWMVLALVYRRQRNRWQEIATTAIQQSTEAMAISNSWKERALRAEAQPFELTVIAAGARGFEIPDLPTTPEPPKARLN